MCIWICSIEVCPSCATFKRITTEDILCESNAYLRVDPQYCDYYRNFDNVTMAESQCKYCDTKKDAEREMAELNAIPDVPSPPKSDWSPYSDSEYDEEFSGEEEDESVKMDVLMKVVGTAMRNEPVMNRTDADAVEEVSEEVPEEVSEEVSKLDSDSDSDLDWESISNLSERSALSNEYRPEPMDFSWGDGVQLDEEDMFEIEDIFDGAEFVNEVPALCNPPLHKRIVELRKSFL